MQDIKETTAIILVGGQGTRLKELCLNMPKPMLEVSGRPFLHWLVSYLYKQGIRDFLFLTCHQAAQVETWVKTLNWKDAHFSCKKEEKPLGTAGGLLQIIPTIQTENVLVLNGDTLLLFPLAPLFAYLPKEGTAMTGLYKEDASRFGLLKLGEDGFLQSFHEKKGTAGLINGGIYLFDKKTLLSAAGALPKNKPLSIEYDLFPHLLETKTPVAVHSLNEVPFIDIGLPQTLALADSFVSENKSWFASLENGS